MSGAQTSADTRSRLINTLICMNSDIWGKLRAEDLDPKFVQKIQYGKLSKPQRFFKYNSTTFQFLMSGTLTEVLQDVGHASDPGEIWARLYVPGDVILPALEGAQYRMLARIDVLEIDSAGLSSDVIHFLNDLRAHKMQQDMRYWLNLLSCDVKGRIALFHKHYPHIAHGTLPNTHLSKFIGCSRESISKINKKNAAPI